MLYRVRPGHTFGQFDQHQAGTLIELTEAEASAFLDKLELEAAPVEPSLELNSSEVSYSSDDVGEPTPRNKTARKQPS